MAIPRLFNPPLKEIHMNWDRIQGNWKQVTGKAKEQWGRLTDDDFDVVAHLTIETQVVVQRNGLAIDSRADESLLQQIDEQIAILALLTSNQRSQHREFGVFG